MLAFFDCPAEHWGHLRTSNPIESVFATLRHGTVPTKAALSQKTAKLVVFTLIQSASKKWLRLKGRNQLPKVIEGTKFNNGSEGNDDIRAFLFRAYLLQTHDPLVPFLAEMHGPLPGRRVYAPRRGQRMLFYAHWHGFHVFGGVPERGIYDNMRTAVDRVGRGKER